MKLSDCYKQNKNEQQPPRVEKNQKPKNKTYAYILSHAVYAHSSTELFSNSYIRLSSVSLITVTKHVCHCEVIMINASLVVILMHWYFKTISKYLKTKCNVRRCHHHCWTCKFIKNFLNMLKFKWSAPLILAFRHTHILFS